MTVAYSIARFRLFKPHYRADIARREFIYVVEFLAVNTNYLLYSFTRLVITVVDNVADLDRTAVNPYK